MRGELPLDARAKGCLSSVRNISRRDLRLLPEALNKFPVEGDRERIIAVFSYYPRPGVRFSAEEQRGFYGRTA